MLHDEKQRALREHLVYLLEGGGAHASFEEIVPEFPVELRGERIAGVAHTAWQLLEHMRICQWDILEFSRDAAHVSPEFPDGLWPEERAPQNAQQWTDSVEQFRADLQAMLTLVQSPQTDLFATIEHGEGQTILREALLVADHNAYHLGQFVILGKALQGRHSD